MKSLNLWQVVRKRDFKLVMTDCLKALLPSELQMKTIQIVIYYQSLFGSVLFILFQNKIQEKTKNHIVLLDFQFVKAKSKTVIFNKYKKTQ